MKAEVITPAAGQKPAFRLRAETFNEMQALAYLDACMRQDHQGIRKGFDLIPPLAPNQPKTCCFVIEGDVEVLHGAAAPPVDSVAQGANTESGQEGQEGPVGPDGQEGAPTPTAGQDGPQAAL